MRKKTSDDKKLNNFLEALEFLNKELKKNPNFHSSDFGVCFLDTFDFHIANQVQNSQDSMTKESVLMSYIRTVELLIKKKLIDDEFFRVAFILSSIYILKIAVN